MRIPDTNPAPACQWCGVIHLTAKCPQVKAIEYHANGKIKRVEFHAGKPEVGANLRNLVVT
jgi:hypothetical protein